MNNFLIASLSLPVILVITCVVESERNNGLISERLIIAAAVSLPFFLVSIGILAKRAISSIRLPKKVPSIGRIAFLLLLFVAGLPFIIKWDAEEAKKSKETRRP